MKWNYFLSINFFFLFCFVLFSASLIFFVVNWFRTVRFAAVGLLLSTAVRCPKEERWTAQIEFGWFSCWLIFVWHWLLACCCPNALCFDFLGLIWPNYFFFNLSNFLFRFCFTKINNKMENITDNFFLKKKSGNWITDIITNSTLINYLSHLLKYTI